MTRRIFSVLLFSFFLTAPLAAWAQKGKIKIAVQAPLSGEQAALGEHIKLGAQLAVEEAVKAFKAMGYDLELVPQDDQAKAEVGVANARNMVADPNVLVIVGHFNSGVALPASEVYKDAMLVMISPANTATEITDRGYPNVNRVCGRDDVQGPVGARFAAQELKAKSVYIIHDKTTYGQGVAESFRNEAKKLGMKVLGFDGTEERANFAPMIIPMKAKNPALVYFGGIYHQGGLLLKQMREKGVKAMFMGPDGVDSEEMVKIAGAAAVGSYYTSVAPPRDATPETAAFAKKYKQRFGKDIEAFGLYGYDATLVGIKAMEQWLKANPSKKPSRAEVSAAVRNIKGFKGVTGSIEFDNKGDPIKAKYFVLQFDKRSYPGKVVKVVEQQAPAAVKK
ncbi:MAG: branched-chain amino acid ABC transporter substrate-binding protein [Deltaproteobacteria bacterium]|nr:branched-chain amino acid ABC transporter substrate-binding protein [Deltaproteobacteria bacterium]MDZ4340985.1 branched-chain amino acid ABC transporter substrate-binding protein [Candidatus Binatia bacterium]